MRRSLLFATAFWLLTCLLTPGISRLPISLSTGSRGLSASFARQNEPAPQVAGQPGWQTPANLSRSGATTDPDLVIDNNGRYHVFWQDAIDGLAYASGDGATWREPVVVETPFATRRAFANLDPSARTPVFDPMLVADAAGRVHAFWIDTISDPAGVLLTSSAPATQLGLIDAWTQPEVLEIGALHPSATVDATNRIHLAYIRTEESADRPAGVYYRQLGNGGEGWSSPTPVYLSRYLRAVTPETANVEITALTPDQLAIVLDDTLREQVVVSRSGNGGQSWDPPVELDRRSEQDAADAPGPSRAMVGSAGSSLVATWGSGHGASTACVQYYRASADGGQIWSEALPVNESLPGCFTSAQFLRSGNWLLLLGSVANTIGEGKTDQSTYLAAWDGARWSEPQRQEELSDFVNPDTNQQVRLRCLSAGLHAENLAIAGCDEGSGGDVWYLSRTLGDVATWFGAPSVWQGPARLAEVERASPIAYAVADASGSTHAFWQAADGSDIFHSRWDGQAWSPAVPIISAAGPITDLFASGGNGRLFLVWRDPQGLQFAQASADRPADWSQPMALADETSAARAPRVLATRSGELIVTYVIPLNEPRGVFLMRSKDQGATWSEPYQIFDGIAAGWDMVDQLSLTESADGQLNGLWQQRTLPPDSKAIGMVYSRSADDGLAWSASTPQVKTAVEWAQLLSTGDRLIHRLWGEDANDRLVLWHSLSVDNGTVWSEPTQVGSLPAGERPAAVVDPAGQPRVLGLDGGRLVNWFWGGSGWQTDEPLETDLSGGHLAVAAGTAGDLVAVYADPIGDETQGATAGAIYGMQRMLNLPAEAISAPPPIAPTMAPSATNTPTPSASPTAASLLSTDTPTPPSLLDEPQSPGGSSRSPAIAILPAAIVILIVGLIAYRALLLRGRSR